MMKFKYGDTSRSKRRGFSRMRGMRRLGEADKTPAEYYDLIVNGLIFGEQGLEKRKGRLFLKKFTGGTSGGITAIRILNKTDGTKKLLAGYQDTLSAYDFGDESESTVSTSFSSKTDWGMVRYNDYIYVSNGKDGKINTWDGTTLSPITDSVKGRILLAADSRLWAAGDDDNPFNFRYSKFHGSQAGMVTSDPPFSDASDWDVSSDPAGGDEGRVGSGGIITGLVPIGDTVVILKKYGIQGYRIFTVDLSGAATKLNTLSFESKAIGNLNYASAINNGGGVFFVNERGINIISGTNGKVLRTSIFSRDLKDYVLDLRFDKSASIYDPYRKLILIACRQKDFDDNNRVIVYSEEYGAFSVIEGWSVGAWAMDEDDLYAGSSNKPIVYKCFEGRYDAGDNETDKKDIKIQAKTRYNNYGENFIKKKLGDMFFDVSGTTDTKYKVKYFMDDSNEVFDSDEVDLDTIELSRGASGASPDGQIVWGGSDIDEELYRNRTRIRRSFKPFDNFAVEVREQSQLPFQLHDIQIDAEQTPIPIT